MMRWVLLSGLGIVVACTSEEYTTEPASVAAEDLKSGFAFLTAETQRLQSDEFENPGYLWVDRGSELFTVATEASPSCSSCHSGGLTGAATKYPKLDEGSGMLLNLEGRINQCRTEHQGQAPWAYESEELLSVTAFVAEQSKGMPIDIEVTAETQPYVDKGQDYFLTRRGQFNLSCQQCHTENWGTQLRGDTISQGHGNGFPAYRLEWQSLGSLQRRLRDCDTGVRAEPLPYDDPTYLAVELYLATRANGLEIEAPAVRR
ncbi:MAG: sulfur oxidation c-type cytochrome SoxA [Pseudomonadota bacterium]